MSHIKKVRMRAQQYVQLEEAIKGFSECLLDTTMEVRNNSTSATGVGGKTSTGDAPPNSSQYLFHAYEEEEFFTPLILPIEEVFQAIKDEPWVKRSSPIQS